ncbi:fructosamine kinase family protein [Halorussus amylolyticus]|uniref:fructosamine kinase family protein n=1 Tax=Halorussus amylolyticus TaxID=1126242 RepID=UPI0010510B8C|nr:fructosamine kinase family protein [Halorussus amylolyticus]
MTENGNSLRSQVADALGCPVESARELDGGEVGRVVRVTLADGRRVVAKTSDTPLDVEADMLEFLGRRGLPIPELHHRSADLLVMAYVEGDGNLTPSAEADVARHLAALHEERPENPANCGDFGFPFDTLDGPYRQPNPWTDSWVAFYRDHRLRRMAEKARNAGLLSADIAERIERLAGNLDSWLPESPPAALLHGDVWANNVVVRDGAIRAFLDPACYFGHAEVELAYVDFGSALGDTFFETYREECGIDPGFFDGRCEIYQLYPLLVHLLYFEDEGYASEIDRTLDAVGY